MWLDIEIDYWRVRHKESSVPLFSLLAFSPPSCLSKQGMVLSHGLLHARMISFHLFLTFLANCVPVILRWRILLWIPNRVSDPLGTRRWRHIRVRYQKEQNLGGKCLPQLWVRGRLPLWKQSCWHFWWWPLLSFVQLALSIRGNNPWTGADQGWELKLVSQATQSGCGHAEHWSVLFSGKDCAAQWAHWGSALKIPYGVH